MTTPLSDERDLTNIDRLRIGALHVEPPFADEDLLDEITALESELERLRARNAELVAVLREVAWGAGTWAYDDDGGRMIPTCPRCLGENNYGHDDDCALDAALRGADE